MPKLTSSYTSRRNRLKIQTNQFGVFAAFRWYNCKMASEKPGSIEQDQDQSLAELTQSLLSMENLDRASPEIWPEKYPGMTKFIHSFTPLSAVKLPYSRELSQEDQNYLHQLAALPTAGFISKVKDLHDIAYQLGVEESKEVVRGKYLNLFRSRRQK